MTKRLLLLLALGALLCVGCFKYSSTTVTEEISVCGPGKDGDGKVTDPNLRVTVMRQTPSKIALRNGAGKLLFAETVPAGKSKFVITLDHGNLLFKRASGETLATTPVSAPADAVLELERGLSKMRRSNLMVFRFHAGTRPTDPLFELTVDRGAP